MLPPPSGDREAAAREMDLSPWSFPAVVVVRGNAPAPSLSGASLVSTVHVPASSPADACVLAGAEKVPTEYMILLQLGHRVLPEGLRDVLNRLESLHDRPACVLPGVHLLPAAPFAGGDLFELASSFAGLTRAQFVTADIDRPFTIPLSGVVLPVAPFLRFSRVLRAFAGTIRFGSMMLTPPGIRLVIQSPFAVVEMPATDLLQMTPREVTREGHVRYTFAQALYAEDPVLSLRLVYEMVSSVMYARSVRLLAAAKILALRSFLWPPGKRYGIVARRTLRDVLAILRYPDAGRRRA
jgi:hypothetical protein